jgi:hypothetical protein
MSKERVVETYQYKEYLFKIFTNGLEDKYEWFHAEIDPTGIEEPPFFYFDGASIEDVKKEINDEEIKFQLKDHERVLKETEKRVKWKGTECPDCGTSDKVKPLGSEGQRTCWFECWNCGSFSSMQFSWEKAKESWKKSGENNLKILQKKGIICTPPGKI